MPPCGSGTVSGMYRGRDSHGSPWDTPPVIYRLAPMSAVMWILTIALLAIPVALAGVGLLMVGLALTILYLWVWLWMRRRHFVVDEDAMVIAWPFRSRRIERTERSLYAGRVGGVVVERAFPARPTCRPKASSTIGPGVIDILGCFVCNLTSAMDLDDVECHVDARRHPCRGNDSVVYIPAISIHDDVCV